MPARASVAAPSLYALLRDRLKAEILGGRRRPGERLPSEAELSAEAGVSRITVRLALADLVREGLVVKAHGKGSFVAHPPAAHDLSRLTGLAEFLSGAGRTIHTRVLSLRTTAAPAEVATRLDVPARTPVVALYTLRYLDRKPLALNRSWFPRDPGDRLMKADFANRDILSLLEGDAGVAVSHADLSIGAVPAGPAHRRHLGVAEGTPLVHVTRVVHATDGRAVHLEVGSFRADRFRYSLRLSR